MAGIGVPRRGGRDRFQGLVRLVIDVVSAGHEMRVKAVVRVDVRLVVEGMVVRVEAQRHLLVLLRGIPRIVVLRIILLRGIDGGLALLRDAEARRLG